MLAVDFHCLHSSSSNDKCSPSGEEAASLKAIYSEIDSPVIIGVDDKIYAEYGLNKTHPALQPEENTVSVAMDLESEDPRGLDGSDPKFCAAPLDQANRTSNPNASEVSSRVLCGFSSICGKRPEMEDAIAVKPKLLQVPSKMLTDSHVNDNTICSLAHFFGVYDGHGGFQVLVKNHYQNKIIQLLLKSDTNWILFSCSFWLVGCQLLPGTPAFGFD